MSKLVAHTLASYMNPAGACYPGLETIRRGCSAGSRSTISNALRRLEDAGFLRIERSTGRTRSRYFALLPTVHQSDSSTVHEQDSSHGSTVQATVQSDGPNCPSAVPEPEVRTRKPYIGTPPAPAPRGDSGPQRLGADVRTWMRAQGFKVPSSNGDNVQVGDDDAEQERLDAFISSAGPDDIPWVDS